MSELLQKQWFRLGAGGVIMAVLGFAVTLAATSVFGSAPTSAVDRVSIVHTLNPRAPDDLPLNVGDAVLKGWKGSIRCVKGQGRYYRLLEGEQADPLMLLFNADGDLIGINLHSPTEQPAPWGASTWGASSWYRRQGVGLLGPQHLHRPELRGVRS